MSMRDQARSAAAEEGNQIDLTPMLDVVFIMLIFFIVTSSFVSGVAFIPVKYSEDLLTRKCKHNENKVLMQCL